MIIYNESNNGLLMPLTCFLFIILILRVLAKILAKEILMTGPRLLFWEKSNGVCIMLVTTEVKTHILE